MGLTGGSAKKLFSGKEYQKVLEYEVKQQWTLKPEEIKGDAVKHLYEKMEIRCRRCRSWCKNPVRAILPLRKQ